MTVKKASKSLAHLSRCFAGLRHAIMFAILIQGCSNPASEAVPAAGTSAPTETTVGGAASVLVVSINTSVQGVELAGAPSSLMGTRGFASMAQSILTVSSSTVVSGGSVTLTLTRRDAAGNLVIADDPSISFSKISGVSEGIISAAAIQADGTYTGTFTGIVAGSAATLSADIGGNSLSSTLPAIQVLAGSISLSQSSVSVDASTVAGGMTTTIRLTGRDENHNLLTSGGSDVEFSCGGGTSVASLGTAIDNLDGTYSVVLTGVVSGTASTASATVQGALVTGGAATTITVVPGILSLTASTISVASATIAEGSSTVVTVFARDDAGNILGTGGSLVEVRLSGGTSTGTISAATDLFDGTYIFTITGQTAGTATSVVSFINGSQLVTTNPPCGIGTCIRITCASCD